MAEVIVYNNMDQAVTVSILVGFNNYVDVVILSRSNIVIDESQITEDILIKEKKGIISINYQTTLNRVRDRVFGKEVRSLFVNHVFFKLLTVSLRDPYLFDEVYEYIDRPYLASLMYDIGEDDTFFRVKIERFMYEPYTGFCWIDDELVFLTIDPSRSIAYNCIRNYDFKSKSSHPRGTKLYLCPSDENELSRMLRLYELIADEIYDKIRFFPSIKDIDGTNYIRRMPSEFLPYQSLELGWVLDTTKPDTFQRKWILMLVPMYKLKGTKKGIRDVVYFLTGFKSKIMNYFDLSLFLEACLPISLTKSYSYAVRRLQRYANGIVKIDTFDDHVMIDGNIISTGVSDWRSCGTVDLLNRLSNKEFNYYGISSYPSYDSRKTSFDPNPSFSEDTELIVDIELRFQDTSLNAFDIEVEGAFESKSYMMPVICSLSACVFLTSEYALEISPGTVDYYSPREYFVHLVQTDIDDSVVEVLEFEKPASVYNYNVWDLFYDDFTVNVVDKAWFAVNCVCSVDEKRSTMDLYPFRSAGTEIIYLDIIVSLESLTFKV